MRLIAILFLCTFVACTQDMPNNILPPGKMKPVIFDMLKADEYLNNFILKDTLKKREVETLKMYDQVFQVHNISSKQFFESYRYYQSHPDKNKVLIDSLNALATRTRAKLDSANIKVEQ